MLQSLCSSLEGLTLWGDMGSHMGLGLGSNLDFDTAIDCVYG